MLQSINNNMTMHFLDVNADMTAVTKKKSKAIVWNEVKKIKHS